MSPWSWNDYTNDHLYDSASDWIGTGVASNHNLSNTTGYTASFMLFPFVFSTMPFSNAFVSLAKGNQPCTKLCHVNTPSMYSTITKNLLKTFHQADLIIAPPAINFFPQLLLAAPFSCKSHGWRSSEEQDCPWLDCCIVHCQFGHQCCQKQQAQGLLLGHWDSTCQGC